MLGLLLFAALSGCADYTMVGIEKRQAEILVHPTHIDFGHLESGFESESKYCHKHGRRRFDYLVACFGFR